VGGEPRDPKSPGLGGREEKADGSSAYGLLGVPREAAVDVDGEGGGEVERGDAQSRRQRLERQVAHRHRAAPRCFFSPWGPAGAAAKPSLGLGDSVSVLNSDEKQQHQLRASSRRWELGLQVGALEEMDGCGLGPCNIPLSLLKCHGPGGKRVITCGNAFHSKKNVEIHDKNTDVAKKIQMVHFIF